MKLSKECIEAIEKANPYNYEAAREIFEASATEALTNPSIYSKAGLISLEDMDLFLKWARKYEYTFISDNSWYNNDTWYPKYYTTAQLFQIYQQQKEKK